MGDVELTNELKEMNAYWRLLAGLTTELTAVLDQPGLSDAERVAKVRELHSFVRPYLRQLPESVRAEKLARPGIQAVFARLAKGGDDTFVEGDLPPRPPTPEA